jgi:predicted MFS family arabinose efflux permease
MTACPPTSATATTVPTGSGAAPGRLPWGSLLALTTAAFTAVVTELLPAGLLPQMAGSLHVSESRIGFLVTLYATVCLVAAIPLTAALRGVRRRPVLLTALAAFAAADAVTAVSSSYAVTGAARLLAGAAGGTMWAMLAGYGARLVPAAQRGRALAVVLAGITVALCAGIPAATAVASLAGWRITFMTVAVLAGVVAGWVVLRVPDFPGEPAGDRIPVRRVVALPGIPAVLTVTLLLLLGHAAVYTYLSPVSALSGPGGTGTALLVFGVAAVAGVWVAGTVADHSPRRALLVALGLVAATMLALSVGGSHRPVLLASVTVWGFAFGGAPTLIQTALVDAAGPRTADLATALQTTVYNGGIALGSLLGGLLLDGTASHGWGPRTLPATALPLVVVALLTVAAGRTAFPACRRTAAPTLRA